MRDSDGVNVAPHDWARKGWRFWLCRHCHAPKVLHPRAGWVVARALDDTIYLSADAPHFNEGW
ncbi:hypothetical protein [Streptomyces rhizosphaerihabitans]|uniref:hypothetical protein n=1 Tax=Streptomyces rhizosphaerihabitans TaxID=1266770 RepID=UPI0021BEA346|nr:hypothetical protein [Streptomyces rhizosphaerihabitans]MCT9010543.1 hypothetical protein [Streptomyces rhizosphaerihabitans]